MSFSIRGLLFLIMVVAIAITGAMKRKEFSVERVNNLVGELNGTIWLDNQTMPGGTWEIEPRLPNNPADPLVAATKTPGKQAAEPERPIGIRGIHVHDAGDGRANLEKLLREHRGLSDLEILKITGTSKHPIAGKRLYRIGKLQNLRFLELANVDLDHKVFAALSRIEDLEVVYLIDCRYEIEDLESLASSPNLAWVNLGRDDFDRERLESVRAKVPKTYLTFPIRK